MIITLCSCVIYAYICSMVKGRMRGNKHPSFARIYARMYMARDYGADLRNRIVSATLTYDKTKKANC